MKKPVSMNSPGQLTVLAALLAGLCVPAMAASDIVISQIHGGGGNSGAVYKNDFIELFNRGAGPVTLTGWSVQYASKTGTTWAVTPIPTVTLAAGQYLLVQEAAGSNASAQLLPAAQATGSVAMASDSAKVALSSSTAPFTGKVPSGAALRDLVGYGSAADAFEGSAPTATISNTVAALRGDGGCIDTDQNGTDFATGPATPRNINSPLHVCGAPVLTCPANMSVLVGRSGSVPLSAFDTDAIVNSAVIKSGAAPGISLGGFTPAGAFGESARVNLDVASGVPAGSYPVLVEFSNDQAQAASCTVNVSVQELPPVTFTIPQIQGAGATSPHLGVQTTDGVVTMKVGNGFFLQDELGDGNVATSDAIFVFTNTAPSNVAIGDRVRVTGTVTEFKPATAPRSVTEIASPTAVLAYESGHSITPTNIVLPGDGLAQYEGMLVHFNNPLIINQASSLGDRGELTLASVRREVPTNRFPAGSTGALALAASNAADAIVLDDGIFVTPTVVPYIGADSTVRVGDTVTDLVGVVDYGSIGNQNYGFKLQPTAAPTISRTNPRTTAPELAAGNVRVASANVLNFFTTFTNGSNVKGETGQGCSLGSGVSSNNCRGADNLAEFIRQRDKIVNELKAIDADVVGLMEIQNNGTTAVSYLVDSLNAAIGSTAYAYVPTPPTTGTDAIRVAMIYKPAVVSLVGAPMSDNDAVNNRDPLAQTFKAANGAKFSVIVNHLKSKGGSCPALPNPDADKGDSQGCWNEVRKQQATRLASYFIPAVKAAAGDDDVLVIGDMNSHGFEDPINILTGSYGMVNELERFVRPNAMVYSYVFDGESGYLDHALSTPSLSAQVAGATEWHNNADEPDVIDYNKDLGAGLPAKPQDLYVNNAYRASDHDPVVVSLDLAPSFVNVTPSFSVQRSGYTQNRATGQYTGTYSFTNKTGAAINGPFQLELAGLPSGVTLVNATGSHNGAPYITVANASIAAGATISVTTTFTNPAKVSISYTATIYSGTF